MAVKACHVVGSATQVGLTPALGRYERKRRFKHMSRSVLAVVALGLMLVASSVPAQNTSKPATGTEIPDVTLPPELDRVLRDYERAWRAGDAAALASLFTEDGFILQSNRPPIRGRSRSEEHTSEIQSLMRISYAVFCLKTKTT